MPTSRNIVVVTDFSTGSIAAINRAVLLAQEHSGALRLLHAFDVGAWHSLLGIFDRQGFTMDPPPDVRLRQRLTEQAAALQAQTGLKVETRYAVGKADSAIIAYTRERDASFVVIGADAEAGMTGLGSVAQHVFQHILQVVLVFP